MGRQQLRWGVSVAVGLISADPGVPAGDALALLRAAAFSREVTVDDLAGVLVSRAVEPDSLE